MNKNLISVIIPTLNEEKAIKKIIKQCKGHLKDYKYEIIVVDKSNDDTAMFAKQLGAKVLKQKNFGKGNAIKIGLENSNGNTIVILDGDGSHSPKEIINFLKKVWTGYDLCLGSRFIKTYASEDITKLRYLVNKILLSFVNIFLGTKYTDICYGYKAFNRSILEKINIESTGFEIDAEILIKATKKGLNICEVPSFEYQRQNGRGKLNILHGFKISLTIIGTLLK